MVGPRLDPELAARVVPVARRGRAWVEVLGRGERLADQRGADDLAVDLDERALGLVVEGDLADAVTTSG